jgi:hypothetical protein
MYANWCKGQRKKVNFSLRFVAEMMCFDGPADGLESEAILMQRAPFELLGKVHGNCRHGGRANLECRPDFCRDRNDYDFVNGAGTATSCSNFWSIRPTPNAMAPSAYAARLSGEGMCFAHSSASGSSEIINSNS